MRTSRRSLFAALHCAITALLCIALLLHPASSHNPSRHGVAATDASDAAAASPRLVKAERAARVALDSSDGLSLAVHSFFPSLSPSSPSLSPSQQEWLSYGDLANASRLQLLEEVVIPLRVNIAVLGLDGSGERAVDLTSERLEEWFEHLQHRVLQSYVSVDAEDSLAAAFPFSSSAATHRPAGLPQAAHVVYALQFHLINLAPAVLTVIEQTIAASYRTTAAPLSPSPLAATQPPSSTNSSSPSASFLADYQVDPAAVTEVLESLLWRLGLDDAYTLVVMNPKRAWLDLDIPSPPVAGGSGGQTPVPQQRRRYGYRSGLSNEEIDQLVEPQTAEVRQLVQELKQMQSIRWAAETATGREEDRPPLPPLQPPDVRNRSARLQVLDYREESQRWATERADSSPRSASSPPYPQSLSSHIRRVAARDPRSLVPYLYDPYVQEDCLVEAYTSQASPLFFLDLSAGPFAWGPTTGGEGVKTERSFPSLQSFAVVEEEDLNTDTWRQETVDLDRLKAEKLLVEDRLLSMGCDRPRGPVVRSRAICNEAKEAWEELDGLEQQALAAAKLKDGKAGGRPVINASLLHPNAFSFFHGDDEDESGSQLQHSEHIEANHFLSHLSATLTTAVHHLIAPSLQQPQPLQRYSEQLVFHLYVLTDHDRYDPLHGQLLTRLRLALDQVRLDQQRVEFRLHRMSMEDEPELAVAFAESDTEPATRTRQKPEQLPHTPTPLCLCCCVSAMRASVVPTLMHGDSERCLLPLTSLQAWA